MRKKTGHILSKRIVFATQILFLLFLPVVSFAQNNYEIRKINFKGNKTFEKTDLLNVIGIHESNFFQKRIQKKTASLYNRELLEGDIEQISRFYQSNGFLNVEVVLDSIRVNEKKEQLDITFRITEKEPVIVSAISLSMDRAFRIDSDSMLQRMSRQLTLVPQQRFADEALYSDFSTINTRFVNRGFVYSQTTYDLNLNPDSNKIGIDYFVSPGEIGQFGETRITGNNYVSEKSIREQLRYLDGDRYSSEKLDETRKQLYELQLFRIVSINPLSNAETRLNPIPVQITVQEMPRWQTRFGVGYGTEDKFRAFGDVTYRSLFGKTSRINIYVKHSALTPYYASLSWIEPHFFIHKLSFSVNPYIKRENEPGYDTQTFGLNFPVAYKFNDEMRASLTYYLERVAQNVEAADADIPNPEDNEYLYNKSGLSASFSYNSAKPVFSPVRGWLVNVSGKLNGYIFGSDFDYTRLMLDVRRYNRWKRFVLSTRAMFSGIYSSNMDGFIPVEDRFYSGGSNSNRGFARSTLGPKRDSGTPLGGKSILEANVEIRHPLFWRIEIAAFMDVGNVWSNAYHYRINDLVYSAGGGLRVNTPIGPIRLDVGMPLWNEKRTPQFFLSVGQAF